MQEDPSEACRERRAEACLEETCEETAAAAWHNAAAKADAAIAAVASSLDRLGCLDCRVLLRGLAPIHVGSWLNVGTCFFLRRGGGWVCSRQRDFRAEARFSVFVVAKLMLPNFAMASHHPARTADAELRRQAAAAEAASSQCRDVLSTRAPASCLVAALPRSSCKCSD